MTAWRGLARPAVLYNTGINTDVRERSTSPTVSVRKLLRQYEIETAREYVQRSRRGLNLLRQFGPGPTLN